VSGVQETIYPPKQCHEQVSLKHEKNVTLLLIFFFFWSTKKKCLFRYTCLFVFLFFPTNNFLIKYNVDKVLIHSFENTKILNAEKGDKKKKKHMKIKRWAQLFKKLLSQRVISQENIWNKTQYVLIKYLGTHK